MPNASNLIVKNHTTVFFVLFVVSVFFQEHSITGVLLDSRDTAVSFANVLLLKQQDSTFVTGTISNEDGSFFI